MVVLFAPFTWAGYWNARLFGQYKGGGLRLRFIPYKGIALLIMSGAVYSDPTTVFQHRRLGHLFLVTGVILYGHASMDRIFGYGLKYGDHFQHTHLGWIGKLKDKRQAQGQEMPNDNSPSSPCPSPCP